MSSNRFLDAGVVDLKNGTESISVLSLTARNVNVTGTTTISAVSADSLTVTGDVDFGGGGFRFSNTTDSIGINTAATGTSRIEAAGDINTTGIYKIGNAAVFDNATTLGMGVLASSLTSIGTLAGLTVGSGALSLTASTGNLLVDNSNITGQIQNQLGTDTSATEFNVKNDTGASLLTVDGAGDMGVGKAPAANKLEVAGSLSLDTANTYKINNVEVLSASALGAGVTSSSLTVVGNDLAIGTASPPNINAAANELTIDGGQAVINMKGTTNPAFQITSINADNEFVSFGQYFDGGFKRSSATAYYNIYKNGTNLDFHFGGSGTIGGSAPNNLAMRISSVGDLTAINNLLCTSSNIEDVLRVPAHGAPTTNAHAIGDIYIDTGDSNKLKVCTTAGTPGTFTVVGTQS